MKCRLRLVLFSAVFLTIMLLAANSAFCATTSNAWPFPTTDKKVRIDEQQDQIALYNDQTGIIIRKNDAAIMGLWLFPGAKSVVNNDVPLDGRAPPLWTAELIPDITGQPFTVSSGPVKSVEAANLGWGKGKKLILQFCTVTSAWARLDVEAVLELRKNESLIRWNLEARLRDSTGGIWSVTYPQLAACATDKEPGGNRLLIPYRQGVLKNFGPGMQKYNDPLPYPGSAAKVQFMAAYGESSGHGLYYAAEDPDGYSKTFVQQNYPSPGCVLLAMQHLPTDRGSMIRRYVLPYPVIAGPFQGDWWDAAQIYRNWWVRQVWAGKGPLYKRSDVPDWLKEATAVVRFNTTNPRHTLANNMKGVNAFTQALGAPGFGVWYGPFDTGRQTGGIDQSGQGHLLPPLPGVTNALTTLMQDNIRIQVYLQSIIYNTTFCDPQKPAELQAAERAVSRDRWGKPCYYHKDHPENGLFAMCRATDWWQDRLVYLAEDATQLGFCGVYLDSFGKSADECFATEHGHPRGGGNTVIQGQRQMAKRVRSAARRIRPDAIFSGEAPVEAFNDLLDVNLLAVNIYSNLAPVIRTVWGDYGLQYGRGINPPKDGGNIIPEMTRLFLDGTILGRFFCNAGDKTTAGDRTILQPGMERSKAYLLKLMNYTRHGMNWLRFGQYLRPLRLTPEQPPVTFKETIQNNSISVPAVMNSVTRSAKDGSVAFVLANVSEQKVRISIPIDVSLRSQAAQLNRPEAKLARMDEKGNFTPVRSGKGTWTEPIEIEPHDVVFLVLE